MDETASRGDSRIVAWLGYGGLLPFVSLATLASVDRERGALWHQYLVFYGAVILSFVGALHWSFAMVLGGVGLRRNGLFVWSVVPSLIAFGALILHSAVGDILLIVGFLLHYGQDWRLAALTRLPKWYLPLRLRLTVIAIICIATGSISVWA